MQGWCKRSPEKLSQVVKYDDNGWYEEGGQGPENGAGTLYLGLWFRYLFHSMRMDS